MKHNLSCPACSNEQLSLFDKYFRYYFKCGSCGANLSISLAWMALVFLATLLSFCMVLEMRLPALGFVLPIVVLLLLIYIAPLKAMNRQH